MPVLRRDCGPRLVSVRLLEGWKTRRSGEVKCWVLIPIFAFTGIRKGNSSISIVSGSLPFLCETLCTLTISPDDDSNNISFPSASAPNGIPAKTTWTLLLYLSSPATGCKGGETVFYPDAPSRREAPPPPIVADLEVGMALLHRHGRDCMLHEGREVTEGEKWIIRSDLCVKR
jgi:hypothetical protein